MQMPAKRGTTPIAGILLGGISLMVLTGCVQTETASSIYMNTSVVKAPALFIQSGYNGFSQMPGNALLAFRLTGKEE